jgi:hypothetical protein
MHPTEFFHGQSFDEVHVLMPELITSDDRNLLASLKLVTYAHQMAGYPIDIHLSRIQMQYGTTFEEL